VHRGLKHLFQVYEIDSNLEESCMTGSGCHGTLHPHRAECPDTAKKRLIFRGLARLWKAKQKKKCERSMQARAEVHPRMESNRTNEFRGRCRATCVLQNQFCNARTESDRQFEIP